jgi:tetratricopeptide (TPR) repeat protein
MHGRRRDSPNAGSTMSDGSMMSYDAGTERPGTDPLNVLDGAIDHARLSEFRSQVFRSVQEIERLRDWLASPMARGMKRGLVLWSLGRHAEALPLLEEQKTNPAIAVCLARSYAALGRTDEALKVLGNRKTDALQASAALHVLERANRRDEFAKTLADCEKVLSETERFYFQGRLREFDGDAVGAIACYDEALARDNAHPEALFRLAVNVDLRGEDEEARELYERALMHPPVNVSCVINLGILYEDIGNYRRAMQCFDLALQAQPDNARARLYRRDAAAALNMYYDEDQERREDKKQQGPAHADQRLRAVGAQPQLPREDGRVHARRPRQARPRPSCSATRTSARPRSRRSRRSCERRACASA